MTAPFRLYGAALSPYSVKVRAFLRFKGIAHEWHERSAKRQEEFQRYAKLPLIPVLVDADDNALQDSTPILEALERDFPEPSATPADPALAFISALIEDYADEWLNKAMFHYRWSHGDSQDHAAKAIAAMLFEGVEAPPGVEDEVKRRMIGRLHHVGSSPETAPVIEGSFNRVLAAIERLLSGRLYLFGGRPCFADFGLAGQLAQLAGDPTPGAQIKAEAPLVAAWVARMQTPRIEGEFESFDTLRAGLADLLGGEIAGAYLAWMGANGDGVADDAAIVSVEIAGQSFAQKPQRYAAKALGEIRRKRALVAGHAGLAALLGETGCDALLAAHARAPRADQDDDGDAGHDADGDGEESEN